MVQIVNVKVKESTARYDISIGGGTLQRVGEATLSISQLPGKIAVISNKRVFGLYGQTLLTGLGMAGFDVHVHLIGDGERFKDFRTLRSTLDFLSREKLSRTDTLIALGGGVVGDLAGFAASIYLRGIPYIQIPTTLLSMIDSSVGGKTGINSVFGKNLIGSFYSPRAVFVDTDVLTTLPRREITAGRCEAVKQGALSGRKLLDQAATVFECQDSGKAADFEEFLADQIKFKVSIVSGDLREATRKSDARSRKILNFGHTFAHAIEKATNYRYFKHGEAVGWGIIFAAELSKKVELLGADSVKLLYDVVHRAGNLPVLDDIDPSLVLEAFKYDKKNIGDSLQWILLKGIGKPEIVDQHTISRSAIRTTLRKVIGR